MKLLFFVRRINNGGVGRVTANLANMFADKGYKIILVIETKDFSFTEYFLSPRVCRINLDSVN